MSETEPLTRYGWTCDDFDDERLECPFVSVEAALANAKETIEEEAPDRDWEPGTRRIEVEVSQVALAMTFDPERALDDLIDRLNDDGMDDAGKHLRLYGDAGNRLVAELRAVWDAHCTREHVGEYWQATHRGTTHEIEVTIGETR